MPGKGCLSVVKRLANIGRPEAIDVWPWGACWLQDEACQGF